MATDPAHEPEWERPRRGGLPRPVWLAVAVALVGVLGVLGLGDGEDLAVDERDERDEPEEASILGPLDSTQWTRHGSVDSARELAPAADGGVWAATAASGLVRWHADGEYEHYPLSEDHGDAAITALASAGRDSVWVATESEWSIPRPGGGDLAHFDGERWTTHPADDLPISGVAALAAGDDGVVWAGNQVGGPEGLARFDGEEWTVHTADDGLPTGRLTSLAVGDDGALWAATHPLGDGPHGGIARYEGGEWTTWHAGEELPSTHVTEVAAGGGRVWAVGNDSPAEDDPEAVFLRFDDGEWRPAASPKEVRAARVHPFTVDREGALWAIARYDEPGDGPTTTMIRIQDGEWTRWHGDELPADNAGSLATADDGAVWADIPAGVARFDGRTWTTHRTGKGPSDDRVLSATTDDRGGVWVATFGGLSRFAEGEWTRWTAADGLVADTVAAVAVDDGTVWAGTPKGVSRFDGGEWTSWDGDDGLGHDGVASLAVADTGDVWAVLGDGSHGPFPYVGPPGEETDGGLARFDGKTWQRCDDRLPLDGVPTAVAAGDDGAVWVAVRGGRGGRGEPPRESGGVARWADGTWTSWTVADGLPASDVFDVDVADGLVWAGTSDGVARFDEQRWVSAATEGDPLNLDAGDPAADDFVPVVAAEAGSVWVAGGGPAGTVARFDGWAWTVPEDPPELVVTAITLTDDAAWLGTHRGVVRAPR